MQSNNERLRAYQPAVIQELVTTVPKARGRAVSLKEASPGNATSSTWQARKAAQRAALEAQARVKEDAFHAAMKRKQQEVAEEREANFQALYTEVLDGLIQGDGILSEVQQVLGRADAVRREQQVQLYQQWNSQVFEKIQERIKQGMSRTTVQQLEASLKTASDEYIQATNTKLGVFRDVIIESDYNPLKSLSNSIKVLTGDIVDPLKKDLLKTQAEKALLIVPGSPGGSSSRSNAHLSSNTLAQAAVRPTLEVQRWGEGQINATPYGHCIDETGNYAIKRADPKGLEQSASHLYVDDYSRAISPAPYRPGKHMTQQVIKGGRTGLFDLMQSRCKIDPGATGGDSWLEHKGKRFLASPEIAMGRKGLAEVLQQTTNPYEDGRALDDAWLQPSGKLKVPGPEQRRGRADLTEIIQQSSNPYHDGRSLGDYWLDLKGKRRVLPGVEG